MWGPLGILPGEDVPHEFVAADEVGGAFVDVEADVEEDFVADDDGFDVAAGGGEFGAGLGGEEGIGRVADADGEGAVLFGEFAEAAGVGGDHGIEVDGDDGPPVAAGERGFGRYDLGPGIEHCYQFSWRRL